MAKRKMALYFADSGRFRLQLAVAVSLALFGAMQAPTAADDKKAAEKLPKIIVATPLGISPGIKTRLVLRGIQLAEALAIEATAAGERIPGLHPIDCSLSEGQVGAL